MGATIEYRVKLTIKSLVKITEKVKHELSPVPFHDINFVYYLRVDNEIGRHPVYKMRN